MIEPPVCDYATSAKAASIFASIGDGPNCETIRFASVRCEGESALLLGLIKQAHDHFASADMMSVRIKSRILANSVHKR